MFSLQTVLYFFLSLFPLVVVHELGHFLLAKWNGIRVDEFGLGFPPRVATLFRHGGTDYTINALPLGGFVRLAGEEDPDIPGAFAAKGKLARSAVLSAGPGANFLFAALILSALAFWGLPQAVPSLEGIRVSSVVEGQPADEAGLLPGDLILQVNGVPLSEADALVPDADPGAEETTYFQQVTRDSAGVPMDLTVLRYAEERMVDSLPDGIELAPYEAEWIDARTVVAADSGSFQAGDWVLDGGDGRLLVLLSPESETITVVPEVETGDDEGRIGIVMGPASVVKRLGVIDSLMWGAESTAKMVRDLVVALTEMLFQVREAELAGPVGIAQMSRQSAQAGPVTFLYFMSILSVNLGLINLLPIPALDGGRLMFILIEALRGRRVEPSREQFVHLIGFVLVLGLMAIITAVEIGNVMNWSLP